MGVLSGALSLCSDGNAITTCKSWSIDTSADVQSIIASNTYGAPVRVAGNQDWSGSVEGWGHTPPILPGDLFTFTGSLEGTIGVSGPAICDSTTITIAIETGAVINWNSAFSGNGALASGAAVIADDDTCPTAYSPIGAVVELDALPTDAYATLPNVKTITINLTADNQARIDSSTAGQTLRLPGNIDCTVDIDVNIQETGISTLPALNTPHRLRITLAGGNGVYEIDYLRFATIGGIVADRETAAIISASLSGQFSGIEETVAGTDECTVGTISLPGRVYWPEP